ncbi:MAG: AsmA family protein [Flavobacteriales bacterium]|nr:AsmA family protein [Flavobacteriales bacterium]
MKKFLKISGISILVLLLIIVALPFIFKGKIVEIVKTETNNMLNAKVDFGDFDMGLLSSFPDFNFSINNVKVDGVEKFEGTTLASLDNLKLKVDLMSVISGDEIKIKSIYILNPSINALVLADSSANWDIMKDTGEVEDTTVSEPSAFKLGLNDLTIENARITYTDETGNLKAELFGVNFNLRGDMTADFTSLKTTTTADTVNISMTGINYMKNAKIEAKADIDADLANSKYTFKENEFKVNELVMGLDGWVAMPTEDIDMDLKFNAKKTDFKNILSMVPAVYMKDFNKVKTSGKLALDGFAKGIFSETKLPAFALNLLVENAMFKYPDLPKSVNNIDIDLHIENKDGVEDHTVIDLRKFHMEMAGNPVDAKLLLKTPISDPNIFANLKAKLDLSTVKDVMPLEKGDELNGIFTSDVTVKGKMSAIEKEKYDEFHAEGTMKLENMNYKSDSLPYSVLIKAIGLNFSPQHVELSQFDANVGKTDLQANGRIDNILSYVFSDDQVLTGKFNVTSSNLDVNEFMSNSEASSNPTDSAETDEPLSVFEVPKNIDFTLVSNFSKIIYDSLTINNVKGLLIVKDQKIDMQNLSMDLLGGSMIMSGFYETTNPKEPGIKFNINIKDFDVQTVANNFSSVAEMAPIIKQTYGKFNTKLDVKGVLNDKMEPNLKTLNGNGFLQTQNIEVREFKPMVKLADVLKNDKLKNYSLNNTNITYEIKDGRVFTQPFDVKLGNSTGTMSGSSGIDQTIDYKMALKIPSKDLGMSEAYNKLNAQASGIGLNLKAAEHVNVDVLIGGTFTDPKISTSLKGAVGGIVSDVKEQVKEKINQEIDKAKEQAIAKAKEEAAKLVAEAKNQSDKLRAEGKKAGDLLRSEAESQSQKLMNEAGGNPIKKKLAEEAGKKLKQTAEKNAQKLEAEANEKANQVDIKAQEEANKLIAKAEAQK